MQSNRMEQASLWAGGNDYHVLPATEKQLRFARRIALEAKAELPMDVQADRRRLSRWIDEHKGEGRRTIPGNRPSSKQVAFAERIARIKRRNVPDECFRDRLSMSKWIDSNR